MDYDTIFQQLKSSFPDIQISRNLSLAPFTTLKIGGPADIFILTKTSDEFRQILTFLYNLKSSTNNLPITILGNGSNILIADQGIRGIIIKASSREIEILKDLPPQLADRNDNSTQRQENDPKKYLDFSEINFDESGLPRVQVRLAAGIPLYVALNDLIAQSITGLQWFAHIPGTIGGAVWCNIHGGSYNFSEFIDSIDCFDLTSGQTINFKKEELDWGYDCSYFQNHPELVITSVTLNLYRGDAQKARAAADAWVAQKHQIQDIKSAGSVFKNPSLADCVKVWGEQKSAGWIIDHKLNWKGKTIGGAQISPLHANIIANTGTATAADYYSLVKSVQTEVKSRFGIDLEMEVKLLGKF